MPCRWSRSASTTGDIALAARRRRKRWSARCVAGSNWRRSRVTAARQFVRLPAGNQGELLTVWRREQLSARELNGTVDLLLAAATRQQAQFILSDPRRALKQAHG